MRVSRRITSENTTQTATASQNPPKTSGMVRTLFILHLSLHPVDVITVSIRRFHSNFDVFRLGSRLNVCRWMFRNAGRLNGTSKSLASFVNGCNSDPKLVCDQRPAGSGREVPGSNDGLCRDHQLPVK